MGSKADISLEAQTELEKLLISVVKKDMIIYVQQNQQVWDELLNLAISNRQPFAWRAAWLLGDVIKTVQIPKIEKNLPWVMDRLATFSDNQQWQWLIILYQMNIPEKYIGFLFSYCLQIFMDHGKKPAFRSNAYKILIKISEIYPELRDEVRWVSGSPYFDSLTHGVRHSLQLMVAKYKLSD